jgi:hypothetical protein
MKPKAAIPDLAVVLAVILQDFDRSELAGSRQPNPVLIEIGGVLPWVKLNFKHFYFVYTI